MNWTDEEENIVSESAEFIPSEVNEDTVYTANFELISDDPAEKIVTVTYKASEGGSVTLDTEHVNSGDPEFTCKGAEAKAADGYEFVNWTDAEGEEVSAESVFIPVLKANEDGTYSDAAYTANFKNRL